TIVRYLTASTLALALMAAMFVTPVSAEVTAEQSQELEQSIECTVGSYGQNTTCKASQSGKQRQRILGVFRKDGKFVPVHKPADTGLDTASLAVVGGTVVAGSAAAFLRAKSRKA